MCNKKLHIVANAIEINGFSLTKKDDYLIAKAIRSHRNLVVLYISNCLIFNDMTAMIEELKKCHKIEFLAIYNNTIKSKKAKLSLIKLVAQTIRSKSALKALLLPR